MNGEADLPDDESVEEEEADLMPKVTRAKAHEAFSIALHWLEAEGTDSAHLLLVKN